MYMYDRVLAPHFSTPRLARRLERLAGKGPACSSLLLRKTHAWVVRWLTWHDGTDGQDLLNIHDAGQMPAMRQERARPYTVIMQER